MRIRTILAAAAAPLALGTVLLAGTAASAATQPVTYTANAHEAGTPDTTDVAGNATIATSDGPVWAYDHLERKLTAVSNGDGTWAVTIASQGSFAAFANPLDGNAAAFGGAVRGYVNYTVTSDHAPGRLPAQLPSAEHSGDVVAQWFGVPAPAVSGAVVSGLNYSFSYTPVPVPADNAIPYEGYQGITFGAGPNALHYDQAG